MTKARLLREIDSREITQWMAYYLVIKESEKEKQHDEEQKTLQEKFKAVMGGRIIKKSGK